MMNSGNYSYNSTGTHFDSTLTPVQTTVYEDENPDGAALYIVIVVLTYTLSIIALLATLSFRKKNSILQDQEAANYIKFSSEIPKVVSKIEVARARKFGIRSVHSTIPIQFFLLAGKNRNRRSEDQLLLDKSISEGGSPDRTNNNFTERSSPSITKLNLEVTSHGKVNMTNYNETETKESPTKRNAQPIYNQGQRLPSTNHQNSHFRPPLVDADCQTDDMVFATSTWQNFGNSLTPLKPLTPESSSNDLEYKPLLS